MSEKISDSNKYSTQPADSPENKDPSTKDHDSSKEKVTDELPILEEDTYPFF